MESLRALISRIEDASLDFLSYNTSPTKDKLGVKCSVCCSGVCMGLWPGFCVCHGSHLWSFTEQKSQLAFLWIKLEAVITFHKHNIWPGEWSNGEETVKKHFTAMVLVQVVIVSFDWTVYIVCSIVMLCLQITSAMWVWIIGVYSVYSCLITRTHGRAVSCHLQAVGMIDTILSAWTDACAIFVAQWCQ